MVGDAEAKKYFLTDAASRYVTLWVPNWPLNSLVVGAPPGAPAVITNQRGAVVSATPVAKSRGVRKGMSLLQARNLDPDLLVFKEDEDRQSAMFELVLEVFDEHAAGVTVVRPGLAYALARGPSGWAGGEESLREGLVEEISAVTGAESQVGVARGLGASFLAAKRNLLVPDQQTHHFVSRLALREISAEFTDPEKNYFAEILETLDSLGVKTVGEYFNLGFDSVTSRFGLVGQKLWKISEGADEYALNHFRGDNDVHVSIEVDPPVMRVEESLGVVARLSSELAKRLESRGLFSNNIHVELKRGDGKTYQRHWTMVDATSSTQVGKRVLWQIRAWSEKDTSQSEDHLASALTSVSVTASQVQSSPELSPLWGKQQDMRQISAAVEEVQSLLGPQAVQILRLQGGFDPRTRVASAVWGLREPDGTEGGHWEGGVREAPLILYENSPEALVMGDMNDGSVGSIWIDDRGQLQGKPTTLVVRENQDQLSSGHYPIVGVSGVWMVLGRWWEQGRPDTKTDVSRGPRSFMRIQIPDHPDILLVQRGRRWKVEGIYG